jgi:hypothetical protein
VLSPVSIASVVRILVFHVLAAPSENSSPQRILARGFVPILAAISLTLVVALPAHVFFSLRSIHAPSGDKSERQIVANGWRVGPNAILTGVAGATTRRDLVGEGIGIRAGEDEPVGCAG